MVPRLIVKKQRTTATSEILVNLVTQRDLLMSTLELKKRLINRIQETDNQQLLEEAFRLLELESEQLEVYRLSDQQRSAVNESKEQFKTGRFLTDQQVNKDLDEWLEK